VHRWDNDYLTNCKTSVVQKPNDDQLHYCGDAGMMNIINDDVHCSNDATLRR
jgi:hypothetical protein